MEEENKNSDDSIKNSDVQSDIEVSEIKNLDDSKNKKSKQKKKKSYSFSMQKTKNVTYVDEEDKFMKELDFPSAGLLLESAKDEYTKERERTQFLDNKASFFMSAIILMATIFVPVIPFGKFIKTITEGETYQQLSLAALGVLLVVAFGFLVSAFKSLYEAYKIKEYQRFNVENLSNLNAHSQKREILEKVLCEDYRNTIEKNIKNNDYKATSIQAGIKNCAIGFLLLSLTAIMLMIIIG